MNRNSRQTIFAGVNYILAPMPNITSSNRFEFQKKLAEIEINITDIKIEESRITLLRQKPMPLQITVAILGPQIGQLLVVTPELGNRSIDIVGAESKEIAEVFTSLWPNRQIVAYDVTIRDLYDSTSEHAFKELWENRFGQPPDSLISLGRPILGGGFRFVMPPLSEDPQMPLIEVKIESYLQDSHKIFLETQFSWQKPQPMGVPLDPDKRIMEIDKFVQNELVKFVMGEG